MPDLRPGGIFCVVSMAEPHTNPTPVATAQRLAPWAAFAVILLVAVVCFFVFADRVPSLLQALADR